MMSTIRNKLLLFHVYVGKIQKRLGVYSEPPRNYRILLNEEVLVDMNIRLGIALKKF